MTVTWELCGRGNNCVCESCDKIEGGEGMGRSGEGTGMKS